MELVVRVTIKQLLLYLHCASESEVPGYPGVSTGESLFRMPNDKLRAMIWLVGHQVLLSRHITVAVGVGVRIRVTIKQICKQVPRVVVRTKSALLLLYCVYLIANSQVCCHAY